jgi:serine protease
MPEPEPAGGGQPRQGNLIENYARQGSGGRQSVGWLGPPPYRRPDSELQGRRPVVAILDNGCGRHPWLDAVVQADVTLDGRAIGLSDARFGPEFGDITGDLERDDFADAIAGHGTFMAGLVFLACPDVDVLAIRVIQPDGVVVESDMMAALDDLLELVRRERNGEAGGRAIDVLVLSMGYYPELYGDAYEPALAGVLDELGRLGVVVVAAAGNDATTRPMYPAALAPHGGGRAVHPDRVPLICVGASNPSDGTAALFSNFGPWVTAWQPGAGVVSTMPAFEGGLRPVFRTAHGSLIRSAIDPDDYRSGFAVWSGTSFAAPSLAGRLCSALLSQHDANLDNPGTPAAVTRAQAVIEYCTALGQG